MRCDGYDFVVVEYSQSFPDAEFRPCMVLVGENAEDHNAAVTVYRSRQWNEMVCADHQEYLESLIADWTAPGGDAGGIQELTGQLQRLMIGPIRMGDRGQTDRAGLSALLERVLGIPSEM